LKNSKGKRGSLFVKFGRSEVVVVVPICWNRTLKGR
jgi:hypothetical protein